MNQNNIKVLAHYYIEPLYNPTSLWRKRIAVEVIKVPTQGDIIVIDPRWMSMNETILNPGAYQAIEVRPNKEHPDIVYDYTPYGSYFYLDKMKMIIVKPLFIIPHDIFSNFKFETQVTIADDGVCEETLLVTNILTGEIKEIKP